VAKILDSVIAFCILIFIILLGKNVMYILGGTIVLLSIQSILYFTSYIAFKKPQIELSLLNLILLIIFGINYLNYCDQSVVYSKLMIVILFCILIASLLICLIMILTMSLPSLHDNNQEARLFLIRQKYLWIILHHISFSFLYILTTCLLMIDINNRFFQPNFTLLIIPISFIFLSIFLISMVISLARQSHLFVILSRVEIKSFKSFNPMRSYLILISVILLVGSVIEIMRGQWILWFESFLSINIITILVWRLYKSRTSLSCDLSKISFNNLSQSNILKSTVKICILHSVIVFLTLFSLAILFNVLQK